MPEASFSLSFSPFVLLLVAVLCFAGAFFVYRSTIPPVSQKLRVILTFLRGSALFLLFLLLGEPVLSLLFRSQEPPVTLLLIDNSRSMTLTDRSGDRRQALRSVLTSKELDRLRSIGEVKTVLFDGQPRLVEAFDPDSLLLTGDHTDLSSLMRYVREVSVTENIRSAVLLSDGNATLGASPLLEADDFPVPLFTIAIGDSTEQRDLLIRKVLTNDIAYSGMRVPVNVQVLSSGFEGERVEVMLRNSQGILDRAVLSLEAGTREYAVRLGFVPTDLGRQQYTLDVSELPEEVTVNNNRSRFSVKVLKSKVKLLMLAGAPSPDVAFLRRSLENDQNFDLTTIIEGASEIPDREKLTAELAKEQDCIIIVGIPGARTTPEVLTAIVEAERNGVGVLFIPNRTLDIPLMRALEPALPVSLQRASIDEIQAFFHVPDSRRNHALLRVSEVATDWSVLPPLFTLRSLFRAKPESDILTFSRIQAVVTSEPLLVIRNVGGRKSAALLGYGLWRWKMLPDRFPHFEQLLGNLVRWLTVRDDTRPVRVDPTEEVFTTVDAVEFSGQVYDEAFRPVDDAQIDIVIAGNGEQYELALAPLGNGQYEGRNPPLEAGDYQFVATVKRSENVITTERGSFSVGGLNAEFLETRTNTLLLRQLADRTGGAMVDPSELSASISEVPNFRPRTMTDSDEFDLWNLHWTLSALILLFSTEWFLRKRNGML